MLIQAVAARQNCTASFSAALDEIREVGTLLVPHDGLNWSPG
jgi:hypothetical protein